MALSIEKQVSSLELSKRLKELGVKQESLFWWTYDGPDRPHFLTFRKSDSWPSSDQHYSAFTVAELGEMLPCVAVRNGLGFWFETGKSHKNDPNYSEHSVSYSSGDEVLHLERESKEADARAKMLIYLIENNLIDFNGLITSYPAPGKE